MALTASQAAAGAPLPMGGQQRGESFIFFFALKRTLLYQTWVFSRMPASNSSFAFVFL
jgi:hypothetical protein